jgi:hypothetical protein
MTQVQRIEEEVASLPKVELAKFRSWFENFDAKAWDKQIEKDIDSGKLDDMANNAIADFKAGNYKEI